MTNTYFSSYIKFSRKQWSKLRKSIPLTLTNSEIIKLKKINENLSIKEVVEIYIPLSRLLNFYINSNISRQVVLKEFFGTPQQHIPYIIGITGSVAVGKSTTARVLQALLSIWPEHRRVELVTTDGFLYPNKVLKKNNMINKKGFPQSYDINRLINFIGKIKSGVQKLTVPVYSHLLYDIILEEKKVISLPDILIIEGLNVLQGSKNYKSDLTSLFVSDFIDFSIYVDAPEYLLKKWYINRFLKFRKLAFSNPKSYFHNYSKLSKNEAISIASRIWVNINGINLKKNILPTRKRANLILKKIKNHAVDKIFLRK